jgi:hypothetical protein
MMVAGRLLVLAGSVGRPQWGRFNPFAKPLRNVCYLAHLRRRGDVVNRRVAVDPDRDGAVAVRVKLS